MQDSTRAIANPLNPSVLGLYVEVSCCSYKHSSHMNTCIFALMDSGTNYIPCLKSEVMLVTLAMSPGKAIFISATHLTVAMSISSNEQGYNCIDLKDYRSTFAYTGSV